MTLRLLISLELLLAAAAARAQTAVEFFNGGAQFYISNNISAALQKVESGRKLYPDDEKLKKLEELLKRQSQQQQQQQQSQQNQQSRQNQSNQQQEQKNQQSQQQNSGGQQNQSQHQNQQAQPSGQPEKKTGQGGNEEQVAAASASEMKPEEAERLLDAQKGSEQFLQLKPQGKPEKRNRPIKDW
jgi:Ca-activated chloride channel family protein